MAAKKPFNAQSLRAVLAFLLVAVILGGGYLFYYGLNQVSDYSIEVNQSLHEADASNKQVAQLQLLKSQLSQSDALISKADSLFASPATYQGQASTDLKNYANQVGLSITSIAFDDPAATGSYAAIVSFKNPVNYSKFIQFLSLVEGNLPKMQVSSLSLKHQPSGSANDVVVETIKINIAVR